MRLRLTFKKLSWGQSRLAIRGRFPSVDQVISTLSFRLHDFTPSTGAKYRRETGHVTW